MSRSYAILVEYKKGHHPASAKSVTLYVTVNHADLGQLLSMLNSDNAVEKLSVTNTITLPAVHKLAKLNNTDLGLDLKKLK